MKKKYKILFLYIRIISNHNDFTSNIVDDKQKASSKQGKLIPRQLL